MFDIDNHEQIQLYVSKRKEGAIVIPMYVSQYGKRYELTELDQIHDYCPGTLRIGFGSCDSVLEKNAFPMKSIYEVDVISVFSQHDDIKNVDVKYIVFETTGVSGDGPLYEQIDVYVKMLNEYIEKSVKSYRQSLAKAFLNEE